MRGRAERSRPQPRGAEGGGGRRRRCRRAQRRRGARPRLPTGPALASAPRARPRRARPNRRRPRTAAANGRAVRLPPPRLLGGAGAGAGAQQQVPGSSPHRTAPHRAAQSPLGAARRPAARELLAPVRPRRPSGCGEALPARRTPRRVRAGGAAKSGPEQKGFTVNYERCDKSFLSDRCVHK